METTHLIGHAPRTAKAGRIVTCDMGQCVGCPECRGLCWELLELVTLPDAVLDRKAVQ